MATGAGLAAGPSGSSVAPPEVDDVLGLHCTLSGEVVVQGTDMNPGLQFQIDGAPVAFTAVSPVEARIPLGPDLPGGFHDLTVISELGTVELGSAVVRYPALELPDESALGGDVTVRFDNGEPGSYVLAFSGGAYPDPAPFEAWGWFHGLELDGVWMFAAGLLSHGDTERLHVLTAPNDPFFLGHEFHVQAWAWQADLGLVGFSNMATTTVVP